MSHLVLSGLVIALGGFVSRTEYKWWHGVAFFAGVQVARLALKTLVARRQKQEADRKFYEAEKLPVFAPPAIAFPIAWTINSVAAIAGGLYVLNLPRRKRGRSAFLKLQAGAWAIFAAFDAGYFGLRSPVNAALLTLGYTAFTIASLKVALQRMHDPLAAASLAPTAAWLALANPLGLAQAAFNYDPFWDIGPWVVPPQNWIKAAKQENRSPHQEPASL